MVITNSGLPDPDDIEIPDENNGFSTDDIIIGPNIYDDDSDRESVILGQEDRNQYRRLPAFAPDQFDSSEEEQDDIPTSTTDEAAGSENIIPIEETLVKEVWSAPPPKSSDIEMDSQKVDEVKQAMLNVTLPPGGIPDWAANIPEDEWKQQLMKRLEQIQNKSN